MARPLPFSQTPKSLKGFKAAWYTPNANSILNDLYFETASVGDFSVSVSDSIGITEDVYRSPFLFGIETVEDFLTLPWNFTDYYEDGGTVNIDTTSKVNGTNSLRFDGAGVDNVALIARHLATQQSSIFVRMSGFFPSGFSFGTAGYSGILSGVTFGNTNSFYFNLEDYGTIRLSVNGDNITFRDTGIDLPVNSVWTLQIQVIKSATVGRVRVWLNNSVEASPDYDSGDINSGTIGIDKIHFGKTYVPNTVDSFYLDDFIIDDEYILPSFAAPTVNTFDAVGITESVTSELTHNVSVSDTVGITESVSPLLIRNLSTSDSIGIVENVAVTRVGNVSTFDSVSITENVSLLKTNNLSVSDTVTIAENVQTNLTITLSVVDTISITESVAPEFVIAPLTVSVFDAIGITEQIYQIRSIGNLPDVHLDFNDGLVPSGFSRTPAAKVLFVNGRMEITTDTTDTNATLTSINAYDFTSGDIIVQIPELSFDTPEVFAESSVELFAYVDGAFVLTYEFGVKYDSASSTLRVFRRTTAGVAYLTGSYDPTTFRWYKLSSVSGQWRRYYSSDRENWNEITPTIAQTEPVNALRVEFDAVSTNGSFATFDNFNVPAAEKSESVAITENVTTAVTIDISVSDSISVTDAATQQQNTGLFVFDSISVQENVQQARSIFVSVADSLSVTENVTNLRTILASVFDAVTLSESVSNSLQTSVSLFDALAISESVSASTVSPNPPIEISVVDNISITEEEYFTVVFNPPLVFDTLGISETVETEITRLTIEPAKYRPRGSRADIKQRGYRATGVRETWTGSAERMPTRGTIRSR